MKAIRIITFFTLLLTTAFYACRNISDGATDYYEKIYMNINQVFQSEDTLIGSVTALRKLQYEIQFSQPDSTDNIAISKLFINIDSLHKRMMFSIDSTKKILKSAPSFDGSNLLRNAALELMEAYSNTTDKQYNTLLNILKIKPEDYSPENDTEFIELSDSINMILEIEIEKFNKVAIAFTEYYNVDIE